MASPQVSTVLDPFDRADGLLNAGSGAPLWTAGKIDAASGGNWVIASNVAKPNAAGAGHRSVFTLPADMEAVASIPAGSATGYLALYFSTNNPGTAGWEGYWFIYDTINWKIRKRVSGVTTDVGSVSVNSSGHTLGTGDKVWIHHVGSALKLRHWRAVDGAWTDTPLIDAVDATFSLVSAVSVEASGTWQIDNLIGGAAVSESGPASSVTLTVDADHAQATDAQTRATVTTSQPLKTIQKAWALATASPSYADVIEVKTAVNANSADPKGDARVYAAATHGRSGITVPFGNNTGNQPIVMRGISGSRAAGGQVKWLGFLATGLKNWQFENLQFGYDFGSGLDVLTAQEWQTINDLKFSDCFWTGGGAQITNAGVSGGAAGQMHWVNCRVTAHWSVFKATGGRRLDGAGFRIINSANTGEDYRCHFWWDGCEIDHVQGEDAFQIGTGAASQADTSCLWTDCWFHDVVQPGVDGSIDNPQGVHTDCVQILGGPMYKFQRCKWERCTSTIQASDFHNGTIWVENCEFPRSAVIDPDFAGYGFNAQGTDNIVMINNTSVDNGFGLAVRLPFKQPGVVTNLTLINNIFDGVSYAGVVLGTVIDKGNIVQKGFGGYVVSADSRWGYVELGVSEDTDQELASLVGHPSIAKDAGAVDVLVPTTDRLGRARDGSAPDVGCHETPVAFDVPPQPRPPVVIEKSPTAQNVSPDTAVGLVLYPRAGEQINPASVTQQTFVVHDPGNYVLPVSSVALGTLDEDGNQAIALVVAGELYPLVTYTALASGITDTEGSVLPNTTWTFRVAGPLHAAVYTNGVPDGGAIIVQGALPVAVLVQHAPDLLGYPVHVAAGALTGLVGSLDVSDALTRIQQWLLRHG